MDRGARGLCTQHTWHQYTYVHSTRHAYTIRLSYRSLLCRGAARFSSALQSLLTIRHSSYLAFASFFWPVPPPSHHSSGSSEYTRFFFFVSTSVTYSRWMRFHNMHTHTHTRTHRTCAAWCAHIAGAAPLVRCKQHGAKNQRWGYGRGMGILVVAWSWLCGGLIRCVRCGAACGGVLRVLEHECKSVHTRAPARARWKRAQPLNIKYNLFRACICADIYCVCTKHSSAHTAEHRAYNPWCVYIWYRSRLDYSRCV